MVDSVENPDPGSAQTASIGEFLRSLPPFGALSAAELTGIASRMQSQRFGSGDVIIRQGDRGVAFYLIRSGNVEVVRRVDGPEHSVGTLGPGACFGERALIEDELRNASVVAVGDVEVYALAKSDFWKLLAQIPKFKGMVRNIDFKRQ